MTSWKEYLGEKVSSSAVCKEFLKFLLAHHQLWLGQAGFEVVEVQVLVKGKEANSCSLCSRKPVKARLNGSGRSCHHSRVDGAYADIYNKKEYRWHRWPHLHRFPKTQCKLIMVNCHCKGCKLTIYSAGAMYSALPLLSSGRWSMSVLTPL